MLENHLAPRSEGVVNAWLGRVRAIVKQYRCGVAAAWCDTLGLVALADLAKCMETDTGMTLAATHLVLLLLEPGTVARVPCGYVCVPSALQFQQSKTTADTACCCVRVALHTSTFQSEFEASVGVEEGHFHNVCSSQQLSCCCTVQVSTVLGGEFTRCEFFDRRRANFALAGEFTLDSCCMCGNKSRSTDTRDAVV